MAAPVQINLKNETATVGSGFGNARLYQVAFGNGETVNVRATAFSYTSGPYDSGTHTASQLQEWGGGLGVSNQGEGTNAPAPAHTLDNNGWTDYVLLHFDRLVSLENVEVGLTTYRQDGEIDADVTLALGQVNTGFNQFIDPTTDFPMLSSFLDYQTDYWTASTDGSLSNGQYVTQNDFSFGANQFGNVVMIAGDLLNPNNNLDSFKLKAINVDVFQPMNQVPAPGALALMGLGLIGLGRLRQRKRAGA